MINYRTHSVEELATDEMFRRWVIDPTPELNCFWSQWIHENPDRSQTVSLAKELVISVRDMYRDELTSEMMRQDINEIVRLASERRNTSGWRIYLPAIWRVAAAFVLISGLSVAYYNARLLPKTVQTAHKIPVIPALQMRVSSNNDKDVMTVLLSDNTVVTLSKGSSITYPAEFSGSERRVSLRGEAFFDVSRNEQQPFVVYTGETVTRVLGTSFRIKAFDQDKTELIAVKTGKVSVFAKKEYEKANAKPDAKIPGVILTPNQQVVYIRKESRLERGAVSQPAMLVESIAAREQLFDDKPIPEVLVSLQKLYGIDIRYDKELLSKCRINAQFDDENLKQRMNAICQAIGASYDMVDGQLVITARGCN
ncbi:FecR family protein [Dyadobacter sp. Leaf189]|uniref:FecR family protein n=1 Tax=Dyadobacter sp. Leaf189 TaxID=1736295 RepID=UPI0006F601CD|nr:FecR family protein [Dyadobacter sp. Leaf189]KQS28190.1 iron dicitrate transport regulator FecR [Dyadobacter sp. Leaf189]